MLAALALWLGIAFLYWDEWTGWIDGWLSPVILADWLPAVALRDLVRIAAWLLTMLLLLPLVLATAGMAAAVIAMPLIVGFVAARDYPTLEREHGGSFSGSFFNALFAIAVFAALWIVTLPLWLTAVLGPPLALGLSAWFNQRLFRYDALAEHAGADEFRVIRGASRGRFYMLGLLIALLYTIPFANLFVPVISGLAFTHFSLAQLTALREDQDRGPRIGH
jgi:hypothetical protein